MGRLSRVGPFFLPILLQGQDDDVQAGVQALHFGRALSALRLLKGARLCCDLG
jgi:hypothetical protein